MKDRINSVPDLSFKEFLDIMYSDRYYDKDKKEHVCSICGDVFYGDGNNPEPLESSDKRCCTRCHLTKVMQAIIGMPAAAGLCRKSR